MEAESGCAQIGKQGLPLFLDNGGVSRAVDIALPGFLLCHLKAQVSNLTLTSLVGITLTRFTPRLLAFLFRSNGGLASCLFGLFSLLPPICGPLFFVALAALLKPQLVVQPTLLTFLVAAHSRLSMST